MTVDLDAAIRLLRLLTPLSASLAFITVAIGLVTSHWLYSEEKMSNPKFNRTGDPELEYISKFTVSGLWTLCYTNRELHHFLISGINRKKSKLFPLFFNQKLEKRKGTVSTSIISQQKSTVQILTIPLFPFRVSLLLIN